MTNKIYSIFSVYGIEIEYMIVDQNTLDILPIADKLIEKIAGKITNEVEFGDLAVSNELALHVIEIKTNGPSEKIIGLEKKFSEMVQKLNIALKEWNAKLMPTGMHPWFTPQDDVKLWPHGDRKIYETYHRIFNCRGHGWANLQSIHLNLPFGNEKEFVELHSAVRLALSVIPALTASTPYCEGKNSNMVDARLSYYGKNQRLIPSISGRVIPEYVDSITDYHDKILSPMYRDIAEHDEEAVLQNEWLNSRGAIARFDRDAIEVRIIDSQECANADMACLSLVSALIKHIVNSGKTYLSQPISESVLRQQYDACIKDGFAAKLLDIKIVSQIFPEAVGLHTMNDFWLYAFDSLSGDIDESYHQHISHILHNGNLATRILTACEFSDDVDLQLQTYQKLADCLEKNEMFAS